MTVAKDRLRQQLKSLRTEFVARLDERLRAIQQVWSKLDQSAAEETRKELYRLVHNLAGSGATFGLPALGCAAANLEARLRALGEEDRAEPGALAALAPLLETLAGEVLSAKQVAQPGPDPAEADGVEPETTQSTRPRVFIVDDDAELRQFLSLKLAQRGFDPHAFASLRGLPEAIQREQPAVILMDVMLPDGEWAGTEQVAALCKSTPAPPKVLVMSSRGDLSARLRAMRAGADAYMTKPLDIGELAGRIQTLVAARHPTPYRVLVVDDDPGQALLYTAILQKSDMQAESVTDPMAVIDAIGRSRPEIVLLDLYMPGIDGLDVVRVLRQHEKTAEVPVVFLSGEMDLNKQMEALSMGAEEFLTKPVKPAHLVNVVRNRVNRARQLRERLCSLSNQDPQTGLLNESAFATAVEQHLEQRAAAGARPTIVYLDVDRQEEIQAALGLLHGERLLGDLAGFLRSQTAAGEVLGRFPGFAFVLLTRAGGPKEAEQRAERLRQAVQAQIFELDGKSVSVTMSLGVALDGAGGGGAKTLLEAAHEACAHARSGGGSRAELHRPAQDKDVAELHRHACAELIAAALQHNGFRIAYQPIANLRGDPEEYYQALLRLPDLQGTLIRAARVIPVAEQTGQLAAVDRWMIWHTARAIAERYRRAQTTHLLVHVALSTALEASFLPWLGSVKAAGLPDGLLTLELNARDASTRVKEAQALLQGLAELGIRAALGGLGATSDPLQATVHLPTDLIKLDRWHLQDLAQRGRQQAALPAIVAQAHELGRKVITPFVEDAATLSSLYALGVDFVLGHFVQEPNEGMGYNFGHTEL